ncbi:MAG: phosphoribosyl-AMP cyclohydrolase, partial [Desulfobacterales bacterium]|nr:phosphoribosyl-AMP cyclohydrolase [Desulfobacterales bacterium]
MIALDFDKLGGLVPVIAQDHLSGEILMLAFMNEAAWQATLATGRATYFSRSRRSLWVKGESSGNVQLVREIRIDC